jgi:Delta7-sterol 5-desaturase
LVLVVLSSPDSGNAEKMELVEKHFLWISTFIVPVLYISITGSVYLFLYQWQDNTLAGRKIQKISLVPLQLSRERRLTISSLFIFCVTGYLTGLLYRHHLTWIYLNVSSFGIIYFLASIAGMIFLHDTYFYWTHRLLHRPGLYEKVHLAHHLSTSPDPWTALAFHPVEAVIQAAILPIILCIMPANPLAILIFSVYMVLMNVLGHSGYELFTERGWTKKWFRWKSSSKDHDAHHQYGWGNFGLYFTFWDRWMKTGRDKF